MADRYWVGGTATWDGTAGSKWALTSGGAGGEAVPTSADDVYFDAASGSGTVTTSGTSTCNGLNVNFTGFTGTFTVPSSTELNVFGSLTLSSGMTVTHGSTTTSIYEFHASSGSHTITTAGKTLPSFTLGQVATTATWTLQDGLTLGGSLNVTRGTLDTNNQSVAASNFASSNSNVRVLTLGSSTLTFSNNATGWNTGTAANLTVTSNTASVTLTGTGSAVQFASGAVDFTGMDVTWTSSGTALLNAPSCTFDNVTRNGTAARTEVFQLGGNVTITGTLTLTGNSSVNRMLIQSQTVGTQRTITAANVSFSNVDFMDIAGAGAASWNLASITGNSGDALGNSGITFTTSATQTYSAGGGNNWYDSARWTSRVPLPQDDVIVDATAGNVSIGLGSTGSSFGLVPRSGRNIDFTGFTGSIGASGSPPNWVFFGSLTWASGMTVPVSVFGMQASGRGSHTITSNGKSMVGLTVSAPGGTYTCADALSPAGLTISFGTLDTADLSITTATAALNSTGTRGLLLGTSTVSLTSTAVATVWNLNNTATLTLDAENSTIALTGASASTKTFAGGTMPYGTLRYTVADSPGTLSITGNNTFALLDVGPGRTLQTTASGITHFDDLDVNGENRDYLYIPGGTNSVTTPDHADLDITGDLTLIFDGMLADWGNANGPLVLRKWTGTASTSSYALTINNDAPGTTSFGASDGTTMTTVNGPGMYTMGAVDGARIALKVERRASDGRIQFFTAPTYSGTWTQYGGDFTNTRSIQNSTTSLQSFGNGTQSNGRLYRAQVYNGLHSGGSATLVADFDADAHVTGNATYTDTAGKVWTLNSLAAQGDGRVTVQSSTTTNAFFSARMTESTGKKITFLGDSHTRDGYARLDGTEYITSPHHADFDTITSEIELVIRVALDDWTVVASGGRYFMSKGQVGGAETDDSFALLIGSNTATPELRLWSAGASVSTAASTALPIAVDGTPLWMKITWRDSDNRLQFFYCADQVTEPTGGSWTQLGTDRTLAISGIQTSVDELVMGNNGGSGGGNFITGNYYRAIVRSGIDGATVFDADFTQARPKIISRYLTLADNTVIGHADWYAYNTPTVSDSPGWNTNAGSLIEFNHLSVPVTLYQPSAELTGSSEQEIELNALDQAVALHSPAVVVVVVTGTLDASAVVHTPGVAVVVAGTATGDFGFAATATGVRTVGGVISTTFGFSATLTAERTVLGSATGSFGALTATASGVVSVSGTISTTFGFAATAVGERITFGSISTTFGFSATTTGVRTIPGAISTTFGFSAPASGTRSTTGSISTTFEFAATLHGVVPVRGTATGLFGFTSTVVGTRTVSGVASTTFGFSALAAGSRTVLATASGSFGFTGSVQGQRSVFATATGLFGSLSAPAVGTRIVEGFAQTEFGGLTAHAAGLSGPPNALTVLVEILVIRQLVAALENRVTSSLATITQTTSVQDRSLEVETVSIGQSSAVTG